MRMRWIRLEAQMGDERRRTRRRRKRMFIGY
jgi:hypothetical protein